MQNYKQETFPVYWQNVKTGEKYDAGIAFFNSENGEYRLKIDAFASSDLYYLRPAAAEQGETYFVLEKVIQNRKKRFLKRVKLSEAVGTDVIQMTVPPFGNYKLVVRL